MALNLLPLADDPGPPRFINRPPRAATRPADRARDQDMEIYCLRCKLFEWDDQTEACARQDSPGCPLLIKSILKRHRINCLIF